jgi:hypothetical protein
MAKSAIAARIDGTCERGEYSLQLGRHVLTPRTLAGPAELLAQFAADKFAMRK